MNRSLLVLPILLLSLLSLPQSVADSVRIGALPTLKASLASSDESKRLAFENYQLRSQLERVHEWIDGEKRLAEQMSLFSQLTQDGSVSKEFLMRRASEMKAELHARARALGAEVIYRDPSAWSSCCWINVGENNNQAHGATVVAKNSPVVAGSSVVGVVEYVGKQQSRVRLITDSGLKVAVRAVRGSLQDREIALLIHQLKELLQKHPRLKKETTAVSLTELEQRLSVDWKDAYLAKGEIHGSHAPYFRALSSELKGIGFNCDFPDAEGPARDLRSMPLVQVGDLLLTSGLDGVFPAGLKVAVVSQVEPLQEGAFSYTLSASPAAGNIADLASVFVLPPLGSE